MKCGPIFFRERTVRSPGKELPLRGEQRDEVRRMVLDPDGVIICNQGAQKCDGVLAEGGAPAGS